MASGGGGKVVITTYVKSPSSIWVTDLRTTAEKATLFTRIAELEQSLTTHCYGTAGDGISNYGPMVVAVRNPETKMWQRGKIEHGFHTGLGTEYNVILIDHPFIYKTVPSCEIRPLPMEFLDIPFVTYEVILNNVTPLTWKMDSDLQTIQPRLTDTWPAATRRLMLKLLKPHKTGILKTIFRGNTVVYGDLILPGGMSVSKMLFEQQYAADSSGNAEADSSDLHSPSHFLDESPTSSSRPPKMFTREVMLTPPHDIYSFPCFGRGVVTIREDADSTSGEENEVGVGRATTWRRNQSGVSSRMAMMPLRRPYSLGLPMDILVHGSVRVITSIKELRFLKDIHVALRTLNFNVPYTIQRYAWPAILSGKDAILIGPRSSGKTMSCLIPLLHWTILKNNYSELTERTGPNVVIACDRVTDVRQLHDACIKVLEMAGHRDDIVVATYLGAKEDYKLLIRSDIIISTLVGCLQLLRDFKAMECNSPGYLFVDIDDVLGDKYHLGVKDIIEECRQMKRERVYLEKPMQILTASEKWTPLAEELGKCISKNYIVCIYDYLEAALYGKVKLDVHYEIGKNKINALCSILQEFQGSFKGVVVCQSIHEVEDVIECTTRSTKLILAHENMPRDEIKGIIQEWNRPKGPGCQVILLCTDVVLHSLDIYDAKCLVHFSMPITGKDFEFRFSCLMNSHNRILKTTMGAAGNQPCLVHIFLDGSGDTKELPEVRSFIQRQELLQHHSMYDEDD